ncbi:MAG TPA: GAF domain-containing protein [Variovorax sp.]
MSTAIAPLPELFTAEHLDAIAQAPDALAALRRIDEIRLRIAPGSICSIQQNVTTDADPAGEIRLRRYFSSEARYPVEAIKRKTFTPWTERLFLRGLPFVGEGAEVLERHFDDYAQMRPWGLASVVNVPLLRQHTCYATFNVFGPRAQWTPQEVLGIRLLALAVASWVPQAPGLHYRLAGIPFTASLEET